MQYSHTIATCRSHLRVETAWQWFSLTWIGRRSLLHWFTYLVWVSFKVQLAGFDFELASCCKRTSTTLLMSFGIENNRASKFSHLFEKNNIQYICVPSNAMASRRVPKLSYNNCAQSSKKTFMWPKFRTDPVLKYRYIKCHISTNL